jgi:hypothetical protein
MKNMKRVKLHEASIGKHVVVSDALDATIYTVKEVTNYTLRLAYYENGREYGGGQMDVGGCYHPTEEQLNHELTRK